MNLEVRRNKPTVRSTTGRMAIEGTPRFVTLEPPPVPDERGNGTVCIGAGTFPLKIRWSPTHKMHLPHVEDVPGRTYIELHKGNFPTDVKGCTAIGMDYGIPFQPDYIRCSEVAFTELMNTLYAGSKLTNPDSPEINHVWDVGFITYTDWSGGVPSERNSKTPS